MKRSGGEPSAWAAMNRLDIAWESLLLRISWLAGISIHFLLSAAFHPYEHGWAIPGHLELKKPLKTGSRALALSV